MISKSSSFLVEQEVFKWPVWSFFFFIIIIYYYFFIVSDQEQIWDSIPLDNHFLG